MSPDTVQVFTDVFVSESPEITVSYRSAGFVCEEGLRQGCWVTLSYNASGYLMAANNRPSPPYMQADHFAEPQAFALNADGQDLFSTGNGAAFRSTGRAGQSAPASRSTMRSAR